MAVVNCSKPHSHTLSKMRTTLVLFAVLLLALGVFAVKMPVRFQGPATPGVLGSRDLPVDYSEVQEAAKVGSR